MRKVEDCRRATAAHPIPPEFLRKALDNSRTLSYDVYSGITKQGDAVEEKINVRLEENESEALTSIVEWLKGALPPGMRVNRSSALRFAVVTTAKYLAAQAASQEEGKVEDARSG